jgi:hypothetical protein
MDIENELLDLAASLRSQLADATVTEFRELISAGEYALSLEFLCDRAFDDDERLMSADVATIGRLAQFMGLTRRSVLDIEELSLERE